MDYLLTPTSKKERTVEIELLHMAVKINSK